jgi:hypothetical protein
MLMPFVVDTIDHLQAGEGGLLGQLQRQTAQHPPALSTAHSPALLPHFSLPLYVLVHGCLAMQASHNSLAMTGVHDLWHVPWLCSWVCRRAAQVVVGCFGLTGTWASLSFLFLIFLGSTAVPCCAYFWSVWPARVDWTENNMPGVTRWQQLL